MKILIVGSNSTIANYLHKKLTTLYTVKGIARCNSDYDYDLTSWDSMPGIKEKFDVVIHLAAFFGSNHPNELVKGELINSVGIFKSCQIAKRVNAQHLIYVSTVSTLYDDTHPYFNGYALSKRHAEENLRFFCKAHNLNYTILRPSQVYGPDQGFMKHQALLYSFFEQAKKGEEIRIFGKNDALRNYLYIDDFIEICIRVIKQKVYGEYNLIHPNYVKLSEMAKAAFSIFKTSEKIKLISEKPNIPDLPKVSSYELYNIINYTPQIEIKEGFMLIKEQDSKNNG